jgi:predicted NBD/HSP70 family sugar kinase
MGTTDQARIRLEELRARQAAGEVAALDVMVGVFEALAEVTAVLRAMTAPPPEPEPEPEPEPTPEA